MIDTELELFTVNEAIDAGLINAVQIGATKIYGTFTVDKNGSLTLDQNNFVFKDKFGNLRVGRFKNSKELMDFADNVALG